MRRKALIIGAGGSDLPGVEKDVKNLKSFLLSPSGGAWGAVEIKVLSNPLRNEVDSEIAQLSAADYSFVFFGGHGRHSVNRNTTELQLSPGVHLDVAVLRAGALRHSLVIDACRVLHRTQLKEMGLEAFARATAQFSESNARAKFDRSLESCPTGIVELYSCGLSETAGEESETGGHYTNSLITGAQKWAATRYGAEVLSIKEAHDAAAVNVRLISGGRQNPVSSYPRTQPHFPFAVK